MSPELAAGLTGFVGLCLAAGWVTGFRNRAYVGLLGLAFLLLAGSLFAAGRVEEIQPEETEANLYRLAAVGLLLTSAAAFALAAVSAVRETLRRLRELREEHEAAAEAMLEMFRARREQEQAEGSESDDGPSSGEDGGGRSS